MSQLVDRSRTTQAPAALAPLLALSGGVLTVYVDGDPSLGSGARPAWHAPVRGALRRLVRDAHRTRLREERIALEGRVDELEPELRVLLDPRRPGRGRALFAAVDGGAPQLYEVQASLPSFVALRPHAVVVPLLRVLQDGARAGVVVVSREGVERTEWELGALQPPLRIGIDRGETRRRRRATNPSVPQSFPERDRYEAAADSRALGQLRSAGGRLAADAGARRWDVLVVDGDPRFVDAFADGFALGNGTTELVRSRRPLRLSDSGAEQLVANVVREARAGGAAELVGRLEDSQAATRDPFVLERALDEGRVQHLLLAAPGDRPNVRAESLLRRGFATGAEVTIVTAGEHDLGPAGAAALLRW